MLEDKLPLKGISTCALRYHAILMNLIECRFNHDAPNIVHMTVRPAEIADDEETAKGGKGGRGADGEDRDAGCRCVIL